MSLEQPERTWRCFHCDFTTSNDDEARAHFGDRDDAEEFSPLCKWWSNMDDQERKEQFQSLLQELNGERESNHTTALEEQVRQLREALTAIANSPHRSYDGNAPYVSEYSSGYALGVADGHRCAGNTARAALGATNKEKA